MKGAAVNFDKHSCVIALVAQAEYESLYGKNRV